MATHLDPESALGSPATPMLPRLPSLEVPARFAEADSTNEAEECKTPTSDEHRIPPPPTCPAAPRKPRARARPAVVPCKRALPSDQLEFFEVANRREVKDFFRSRDGAAADAAKRRRFFCR